MSGKLRYESDGEYVMRLEREVYHARCDVKDTERRLEAGRERVVRLETELREACGYYEHEWCDDGGLESTGPEGRTD